MKEIKKDYFIFNLKEVFKVEYEVINDNLYLLSFNRKDNKKVLEEIKQSFHFYNKYVVVDIQTKTSVVSSNKNLKDLYFKLEQRMFTYNKFIKTNEYKKCIEKSKLLIDLDKLNKDLFI